MVARSPEKTSSGSKPLVSRESSAFLNTFAQILYCVSGGNSPGESLSVIAFFLQFCPGGRVHDRHGPRLGFGCFVVFAGQ